MKEETGYIKLAPEKQFFLCYDPEKDVQISLTNLDSSWKLEDSDIKVKFVFFKCYILVELLSIKYLIDTTTIFRGGGFGQ